MAAKAPAAAPAVMRVGSDHGTPDAKHEFDGGWRRVERELPGRVAGLPPGPGLARLPAASAPLVEVLATLFRDGAVILEGAVDRRCCESVLEQMQPYVDGAAYGDDFLGRQTKRASAVVSRSPASWEMIQHPVLMQICEGVLARQLLHCPTEEALSEWLSPGNRRLPFQLCLSQMICIGPGNRWQPLHQDGFAFVLDLHQRLETEISTIWALRDFTEENGATRVVPGSHRWPKGRRPRPEEAVQAAMPAGSVVVYLGSTWHSGGENRSSERRHGLNVDYNLSVLRQEENQYLSCPPEIARKLPASLQALVGYTMAGGALGYFGEVQHPSELLEDGPAAQRPVNWASRHLPEFQDPPRARL